MIRAEKVLRALKADEKDLLREYYDRLFKCLESVQRTTDAELRVILSKKMPYPEILAQAFIFHLQL